MNALCTLTRVMMIALSPSAPDAEWAASVSPALPDVLNSCNSRFVFDCNRSRHLSGGLSAFRAVSRAPSINVSRYPRHHSIDLLLFTLYTVRSTSFLCAWYKLFITQSFTIDHVMLRSYMPRVPRFIMRVPIGRDWFPRKKG